MSTLICSSELRLRDSYGEQEFIALYHADCLEDLVETIKENLGGGFFDEKENTLSLNHEVHSAFDCTGELCYQHAKFEQISEATRNCKAIFLVRITNSYDV